MESAPFTYIDSVARGAVVVDKRQPIGRRPTASYHWMRWMPSMATPRRAR